MDTPHRPSLRALALFVALLLAAVGGNVLHLELVFGVSFIFGSIAILLGLRLLGPWPGTLLALVAGLYTVWLWGHPYALVIFTLEALTVGLLLRRGVSLVLADILYWAVLGATLVWFFYGRVMGMESEQVWAIVLKQPLNGIANALVAGLLLYILPERVYQLVTASTARARVGVQELLFTLMLAAVFFSALLLLVKENRTNLADFQQSYAEELTAQAQQAVRVLEHNAGRAGQGMDAAQLLQLLGGGQSNFVLLNAQGRAVVTTLGPEATQRLLSSGENRSLAAGLQQWLPERNQTPLMKWLGQSLYWVRQPLQLAGAQTLLVIRPVQPLIETLYQRQIESFILLVVILLVSVPVTLYVSTLFGRTVTTLATLTAGLPDKLRQGMNLDWPHSRITEVDQLSENSAAMSRELARTIGGLVSEQGRLSEQVRERTDSLIDQDARSRAIIETAVEAIITIDERGIIESFNPAAESIFGYAVAEVIGRNVSMLMPEPHQGRHDGYLKNYLRTGEAHIIGSLREVEGRRKDGGLFPIELAISQVRLRDRVIFTGFITDITERRQAETVKNEFISTVSHELRTPLTSIRGAIGLLASSKLGELSESGRSMLNITLGNTERLVRLINDILDIQKLESGAMNFVLTPEPLAAVVEQAVAETQGYVAQYRVSLDYRNLLPTARVKIHSDRMSQVLNSLISNAAKFSPQGGVVGVVVERAGARVEIRVSDQGPGIAPEFQSRVFEKFAQADGTSTRKSGGTGLGLSITKSLVERMQGEIGFETVAGQGTTFIVRLPLLDA